MLKKLCSRAWELPHLRDREKASQLDRTSLRKTALISILANTVPAARPTAFHSACCSFFHYLQWRKRYSRVWAAFAPQQH
jgi:hypothetical protein